MKKLSYLWTIIIGLVEIGITISIFNYFYDDFQIKVLSILVIIYTTIRTLGLGLGQLLVNLTYGLNEEFRKLRKTTLGDSFYEEEVEQLTEIKNNIEKMKTKVIINGIVITIMYFIAVFKLLGSI